MEYCIVIDGVIENIIYCEDENVAESLGALAVYDGATIGALYAPPEPEVPIPQPTIEERTAALEAAMLAMMGGM